MKTPPKKKNTVSTLRIFWQHAVAYKASLAVMIAGLLVAIAADLYVPFLFKRLFDALTAVGDVHPTIEEIMAIVVMILVVKTAVWSGWRITSFTNVRFQTNIMRDLHAMCFAYLHGHSFAFFQNNFSGSLVRRVNRYVHALEEIVDQVLYGIGSTAAHIAFMLLILYFHYPSLAYVVALWTTVYVALTVWYALYTMPYNLRRASADTETSGRLADTVTNSINVKLFGGLQREREAFAALIDRLRNIRRTSWNFGEFSAAMQHGLNVVLEITVLYIGIRLWHTGSLTIGDLVLLQAYLGQIFHHLWNVGRNVRKIYESLADAAEMTDMLLLPHGIQDRADAKVLTVTKGVIEFNNLTFSYGGGLKPVYEDFSLRVNAGERVAFVGPSGGGKSTITKLLLRFFDLDKGTVRIDGQDITRVSQESLRSAIAYVPQDPILFHRSLMENIRYARPDASNADVIAAAKLAHADEFISAFPSGYETFVGERGVKLSGGERQRVAIARAILKDAPILVLDEATSSLDSESEMYIQDALHNLMKNKTVIVIAHRLSTIMQMDRILVIDGGKIVEEGQHGELVKASQGIYRKLWRIQAGGFQGDDNPSLEDRRDLGVSPMKA